MSKILNTITVLACTPAALVIAGVAVGVAGVAVADASYAGYRRLRYWWSTPKTPTNATPA